MNASASISVAAKQHQTRRGGGDSGSSTCSHERPGLGSSSSSSSTRPHEVQGLGSGRSSSGGGNNSIIRNLSGGVEGINTQSRLDGVSGGQGSGRGTSGGRGSGRESGWSANIKMNSLSGGDVVADIDSTTATGSSRNDGDGPGGGRGSSRAKKVVSTLSRLRDQYGSNNNKRSRR